MSRPPRAKVSHELFEFLSMITTDNPEMTVRMIVDRCIERFNKNFTPENLRQTLRRYKLPFVRKIYCPLGFSVDKAKPYIPPLYKKETTKKREKLEEKFMKGVDYEKGVVVR